MEVDLPVEQEQSQYKEKCTFLEVADYGALSLKKLRRCGSRDMGAHTQDSSRVATSGHQKERGRC